MNGDLEEATVSGSSSLAGALAQGGSMAASIRASGGHTPGWNPSYLRLRGRDELGAQSDFWPTCRRTREDEGEATDEGRTYHGGGRLRKIEMLSDLEQRKRS